MKTHILAAKKSKSANYDRLRQMDWEVGKVVLVAGQLYLATQTGWKKTK